MSQKRKKTIQELLKIMASEEDDSSPEGGGILSLPPVIEAYYDGQSMRYFMRMALGNFVPVSKGDLFEHHLNAGWSGKIADGQSLSPVSRQILEIQSKNYVDFAGALAGRPKGLVTFGDTRCLVTSEPKFIGPRAGDWSMLRGILERMFGGVQLEYFYGWIKVTLDMFRNRSWLAGQMLFIAGPPGAGKTFITTFLRNLFGGRMPGKPYRFMTGRTEFNSDFFGAELLTIEDEAESTAIQARRAFGAAIKTMTVNADQWLHAKGKPALSVFPLWRMVATLNNEPERLLVIPPVDTDIEDKIMLFLVEKHPMPMATHTGELQKAFMAKLVSELPAFVHFLDNWTIRTELQSPRFGVTHYHHPDLLASLQELSPEKHLLELIDEFIFVPTFGHSWDGLAVELDRALKGCKVGRCAREAEQLLSARTSCGRYLGRLEKLYPGRISRRTLDGDTIWTITPPAGHPAMLPIWPKKVSPALMGRIHVVPPPHGTAAVEAAS